MTTKSKTMNVLLKDEKGNRYTLVLLEFDHFKFSCDDKHWFCITRELVREKDGKKYRDVTLNHRVNPRLLLAIPNNNRGKLAWLRPVKE